MVIDTTFSYDPAKDIPSLMLQVFLITGANTGLGKQSALELAKHGPSNIFMACRDPEKGRHAIAEVQAAASPGTTITFIHLDLGSFESIKRAAREFLATTQRLDVLMLNAGILGAPAGQTREGYEVHMGVNHVGHALLLQLLTPALEGTASSTGVSPRVISVASIGYKYLRPARMRTEVFKTPKSELSSMERYMQSKLANILYAREFAARHPAIKIVALHPGEVATDLYSREPGDKFVKHLATVVAPQRAYSVKEGVKNQLWAATTADENLVSGEYYEPVGEGGRLEPAVRDEMLSRRLWDWTQRELSGQEL